VAEKSYALLGAGPLAGFDRFDSAQALRNTVDLAQLTDELGYTRYWLAEHHNTR